MKKISFSLTFLIILLFPLKSYAEEFKIDHYAAMEAIAEGKALPAFKFYEAKGDEFYKNKNWLDAAKTYTIASRCARATGEYNKAIKFTKKAIEVYDTYLTDQNYGYAVAAANLAMSYISVGEFSKALVILEKGLKKIEKYDGEKNMKYIRLRADLYGHMGRIELRLKNYEKALTYHKKVIEIYDMVYSIQSKWKSGVHPSIKNSYIAYLERLGWNYYNLQEYESAEKYFNEVIKYKNEWRLGNLTNWVDVNYKWGMGDIAFKKKDYNIALKLYQEGLKDSEKLNLPYQTRWLNQRIGRTHLFLKNYSDSENYFKKSVDFIESIRGSLESTDLRASFAETVTLVYGGLIYALINQNKFEEALNYSEKARARAFLDMLGNKISLYKGGIKEIAEEEIRLKSKIAYFKDMSDKSGNYRKKLEEAEKEYLAFFERIQKENPETASLMSVSPLTLKEIQEYLDSSTVILEFFIGSEQTFLWIINKESLNFSKINLSPDKVKGLVNDYRDTVVTVKSVEEVKKKGNELYKKLLQPAEALIKGKDLIIVPHGVLHYLPFHSLTTNNNKFLVDEYSIRYLSSASILKFIKAKFTPFNGKGAVFGNPDFGDIGQRLRYAGREANEIKNLYPASDTFLDIEASVKNTEKIFKNYGLIHFAAHGELNEKNPLDSGIKLVGKDGYEDYIRIKDVFKWDFKMSLVVLSACETGMGKITSGDEIISFTRAFIYAGSPSVIATLWQVNDRASYLLMKEFYNNLKNYNKADALRKAQIKIAGKYQHPYYWAGYFLTGAK